MLPFARVAHVMESNVPRPAARPGECVRETPNLEVALQHEYLPLPQLRHNVCECEAAYTGTDHNRVVFGRELMRLASVLYKGLKS